MTAEQATQLFSLLPNMIFALLALYWMSKRLDRSLDLNEKLIEKWFEKQIDQEQPTSPEPPL